MQRGRINTTRGISIIHLRPLLVGLAFVAGLVAVAALTFWGKPASDESPTVVAARNRVQVHPLERKAPRAGNTSPVASEQRDWLPPPKEAPLVQHKPNQPTEGALPEMTRRVLREAFQHSTAAEGNVGAREETPYMPAFEGVEDESQAALGRYIQGIVRREMFPMAYSCLAERFEQEPSAQETVELRLVISGNAEVGGVVIEAELTDRSTLTDPQEIQCVRHSAHTLALAAPPEGSEDITIVYPMVINSKWVHRRAQQRLKR